MINPVVFKGVKDEIVAILNPNFGMRDIVAYLEKILNERKVFFSGADMEVDPNGIELGESDIEELKSVFSRFGIQFRLKGTEIEVKKEEVKPKPEEQAQKTIVISHTLRAGQLIRHNGNVVILGDINEGAEVNATGSIYVFGVVRGIVNAGESVISLGFMPLRMTIGNVIFDNSKSGKTYRKPRIARAENGKIVVKVLGEKRSVRRS